MGMLLLIPKKRSALFCPVIDIDLSRSCGRLELEDSDGRILKA